MKISLILIAILVLIIFLVVYIWYRCPTIFHRRIKSLDGYKNSMIIDDDIHIYNILTKDKNIIRLKKDNIVQDITTDVSKLLCKKNLPGWCNNMKGPEDPRICKFKNINYIFFCDNVCDPEICLRMFLAPIYSINHIGSKKMIKIRDMKLSKCEKNWTPWTTNDRLYISYMLSPKHIVYELNPETGETNRVSETEYTSGIKLSGGTNAVEFEGKMIGLAHIKRFVPFPKYFSVFYTFSNTYPFEILKIGKPFCFQRYVWCEFPTYLKYDNGKFFIWYGKNDNRSILISIDRKDILNVLNE